MKPRLVIPLPVLSPMNDRQSMTQSELADLTPRSGEDQEGALRPDEADVGLGRDCHSGRPHSGVEEA